MKVFYVFKINENFYYMYNKNSYKIFKILQELRSCGDYDINMTKRKLKEIVCRLDRDNININLNYNLNNNRDYYKNNNVHIICNNNEYTKLIVEDYMIRIKTNQKYPNIFNYIEDNNIFVCDFINIDYFWLNSNKIVA